MSQIGNPHRGRGEVRDLVSSTRKTGGLASAKVSVCMTVGRLNFDIDSRKRKLQRLLLEERMDILAGHEGPGEAVVFAQEGSQG